MTILENEKNYTILRNNNATYFISYNSTIAKIKNNVLFVTKLWNYSQTTVCQFYKFINEYYKTINLNNVTNKKNYIQDLIDKKIIKLIDEKNI